MHIVIDARIINTSTGRYVERLLTYLQNIDTSNQYTVLVPTKDKDFWKPVTSNFTVVCIDIRNYTLVEQVEYKRILDSFRADLVHFCMPQQPVLYSGAKVTTIHDLTLLRTWNSDKNWLAYHLKQLVGRFVFHHVVKTSAHIITDSDNSKDDIIEFDKRAQGKVSTIYLAAETEHHATHEVTLPFKKYLLYVGAQSDYKNIRRLGEAHQLLLSEYPDLGLVLVGKKGVLASRNEEYFSAREYKNIHFTDFIPDAQRDWLYEHCEAYVFPSLMEGFGLPPLEAMTYGTPVVSSNASCMPEILGDAPVYFDPTDINDMALKIGEVLGDEALRAQMIERGYRQVAKYSWERTAQQTHDIYMQVLKNAQ